MNHCDYDVIIAGGGPAGSTAASLLAEYGYRTLILEAGRHPRFHIGESMLPATEVLMQRLGIDWGRGHQFKKGAEFIDEARNQSLVFQLSGERKTYQIERSVFDRVLFENALSKGAEAHESEKVLDFEISGHSVCVQSEHRRYSARYFIDASGRAALSGRKFSSIRKIEKFGRYALYQHFKLARSELTDALFASGNIKIMLVDIGWLWVIPLRGLRMSLGLVVKQHDRAQYKGERLFRAYIENSLYLSRLLDRAETLGDLVSEADFSYLNRKRQGPRFVSCGDAGGFLDPVFSSGFFFAVKTAAMAADRIHFAFQEGRENDPSLHDEDIRIYDFGFQTMYALIDRFYHSSMIDNLVFEADRHPRIKQEITALLAGDLWQKDNLFQRGIINSRRRISMRLAKNRSFS